MADIHGGRVLAGEDSEEDDEDEEEMSFQFNGFGSQASPAAPRFAVPTVVAPPTGAEGEEDEESDEEEDNALQLKVEEKTKENETKGEEQETEEQEKVTVPETKKSTDKVSEKVEENEELWKVDGSINGVEVMSNAFVATVQPSLDATIHRIAELKESQQRLLKILVEQNAATKSNKQLEDAAVVLEKLPFYAKKLQGIKLAMQEISTSTEKMKRRAEDLRIDAQSHAIKKENKRDAQSQWNKLYAAKSSSASSAPSGQS